MKSKKLIFLMGLFLLSITLTGIVSAEVSDTGVEYESKVLKEFNSGESWVDIKVDLRDTSDIIINGTKDERRGLLRQKDEWFVPVIDDVLSTLSKNEFNLTRKTTGGFRGKITKQGFDKLINDARVESVYYGFVPSYGITDNNATEVEDSNNASLPSSIQIEEFLWEYLLIIAIIILILYKFARDKRRIH